MKESSYLSAGFDDNIIRDPFLTEDFYDNVNLSDLLSGGALGDNVEGLMAGNLSNSITIDGVDVFGTSGAIITDVINARINTSEKTILSDFTFGTSGALQIGSYVNGVSGDLRISPNGILGRNIAGTTTLAIDGTTGNATFRGDITGSTGTFGSVIINSGTISWSTVAGTTNAPANNATVGANWNTNLSNIPASATASYITSTKITSTTIESPSISAGTFTGSTFQTAASGSRFLVNTAEMFYYNGSYYPFFVCFTDDPGNGDAGDVGIGNPSGSYLLWDNSAGTLLIRGQVETNSSSYRIILDPSNRRLACYDGSTAKGYIYNDSDGDFKIKSEDDMVFQIGSSYQYRFQINDTNQFVMDGDGDVHPGGNNENKVGTSTIAFAEMNSYAYVDKCLWLDELDDLAILNATQPKKNKSGEILRDKDGNAKLDHYSLPEWIHSGESVRNELITKSEEIKNRIKQVKDTYDIDDERCKSQIKLLEKDLENYNKTEDEIIEMTGRNLGHFVDLVAGAVRQLDRKVEDLIINNKLK